MDYRHPELLDVVDDGQVEWSERDVMLYALAIGMGGDPADSGDLDFIYERHLQPVPSFVGAIAIDGGAWPKLGLDMNGVLHGAHAVTLHRPMPTRGRCRTRSRIRQAWDQGAGRAAVLVQQMDLSLDPGGEALATVTTTIFARRDGGFGGPSGSAPRQPIPDRAPDISRAYPTLPQQALLYRLTGDYNPLHADPRTALAAGFEKPILHGMCSYGIGCRAIIDAFCRHDASIITHHEARFTAPVYPGETLVVDMWKVDDGAAFRIRLKERDVVVVDNGLTRFRVPLVAGRSDAEGSGPD